MFQKFVIFFLRLEDGAIFIPFAASCYSMFSLNCTADALFSIVPNVGCESIDCS